MAESKLRSIENKINRDDQRKECHLCGKKDGYMTNLATWNVALKSFVLCHLPHPPPPNILICKKDLLEARRHHLDPNYTPKWKSVTVAKQIIMCVYPKCSNNSENDCIIKASFMSQQEMKELCSIDSNNAFLCKHHYNKIYRELHPPKRCASCNALPKAGGNFTHHSPNAQLVSEYLNDDCVLQQHDLLCLACYKLHLSINNSQKNQPQTVIRQLPDNIKMWNEEKVRSSTNRLTCAILTTVVKVAEYICDEKAMLLSTHCNKKIVKLTPNFRLMKMQPGNLNFG